MCMQALRRALGVLDMRHPDDIVLLRGTRTRKGSAVLHDGPRGEATRVEENIPENPTYLITLPVETLLHLSEFLSESCLARLLRVHSCLNGLFKSLLYHRHVDRFGVELAPATCYAAITGNMTTLAHLLATLERDETGGRRAAVRNQQSTTIFRNFTESMFGHPLSLAMRYEQTHVVQTLLEEGIVDPNHYITGDHMRPLAWAANRGHIDIVKTLLETDLLDPTMIADPLQHAVHRSDIIELLLQHRDIGPILPGMLGLSSSLFYAIRSGNVRSVWLICAHIPSFYQPDERQCKMLTWETVCGWSMVVDIAGLDGVAHMMEVILWKILCERYGWDFTQFGRFKILTAKTLWIDKEIAETGRRQHSDLQGKGNVEELRLRHDATVAELWVTLEIFAGLRGLDLEDQRETPSDFFQPWELKALRWRHLRESYHESGENFDFCEKCALKACFFSAD